jgi:integrase
MLNVVMASGSEQIMCRLCRARHKRHTVASRLAMEGVDLLAIKKLGGWKTLTMVQRYAHLSPGHQRQAIERLVTRTVSVPRAAEATGQQ